VPFRAAFDCLWCGQGHAVRSGAELEGWASLCPDCLGRAQDNGFLRARLRAALRERGAASRHDSLGDAGASDMDDWYLRRGRFVEGPVRDLPWQMELDEVTGWLDRLGIAGVIVEPAGGTGWWSTLLAQHGELWMHDPDPAALDRARDRLLAHGLRAHLHVAEPLSDPGLPRRADAVFGAFLLGSVEDEALPAALARLRAWIRPGGLLAVLERRPAPGSDDGGMAAGPRGPVRARPAARLAGALAAAGLEEVSVRETASAFCLASGRAPAGPDERG
jgi:hypothetical protein